MLQAVSTAPSLLVLPARTCQQPHGYDARHPNSEQIEVEHRNPGQGVAAVEDGQHREVQHEAAEHEQQDELRPDGLHGRTLAGPREPGPRPREARAASTACPTVAIPRFLRRGSSRANTSAVARASPSAEWRASITTPRRSAAPASVCSTVSPWTAAESRRVSSTACVTLSGGSPSRSAARARNSRSEERRVGKECRSRWSPY